MKIRLKLLGVVAIVATLGFSMAACRGGAIDDMNGGGTVNNGGGGGGGPGGPGGPGGGGGSGGGGGGGGNQPRLTGTATITGTAMVGQTLTVNTSAVGGSGGNLSIQWRRGNTRITGATGGTYVLQPADAGRTINVVVTRSGYSGNVTSAPTATVIGIAEDAAVTWTAAAAGSPTTTSITFTFSRNPGAIAASDFTITSGTGSATREVVSGSGLTRTLAVSNVSAGTVSVSVNRAGVASGSQTVTLAAAASAPSSIEMVRVEGGTFQMGSCPSGLGSGLGDPVRSVTVSVFYIGRFPVTQGQWFDVMGTQPSYFTGNNSWGIASGVTPEFNWRDLPVEQVSWFDAVEFANELSRRAGRTPAYTITGTGNNRTVTWNRGANGYRLPTEAEWEFATRGGNQSQDFQFSGGNVAGNVAWTWENSGERTHPVGTRTANELGLHDMSGNVWEWVYDWHGPYPSTAQTNPAGAPSGSFRVLRGGSWSGSAGDARSADRSFDFFGTPGDWWNFLGFRLVRP